jgi:autotransporter-associated beta strand protein
MISAAWIRPTSRGSWRGATCLALLALSLPVRAGAATHTWNGAAGNLWSLASSWTGGAPSAGEASVVLVFPAGAGNRGTVNDLPGLTVQTISLADTYQTSGQALTLTGGLSVTQGSSTWGTDLTLSQAQTWSLASDLTVTGALHGSGALTKSGTASLRLSPGDFAGSIDVQQGNLYAGAGALGSAAAGTVVRNGASLWAQGTDPNAEPLTLDAGAALRGVGGEVQWVGPITLAGNALLSFTRGSVGPAGFTISSPISGPGGFSVEFAEATISLTGASNTYSGPVHVLGGTLNLQHPQDGLPAVSLHRGTLPVSSGGVLTGSASFGALSAADSSRVAPGGGAIGAFGVNGDLTLRAPAVLALDLWGTSVSGYDHLTVGGAVDLTGGTLALTVSSRLDSQPGDTFLLIDNGNGATPVVGTFANLPEGAVLGQTGYTFRLSYEGGDGNDVTLTTLTAPGRRFFTLPPCRFYDSRDGGDTPLPPVFLLYLTPPARCGIPVTAHALAVNVTVITPLADGYVALFPGDGANPGTSTVNFRAGQIRANNAVVRLATDGSGTLYVQSNCVGAMHLALDVSGYFE